MSKKILIIVNHDIVIYNFRKELVLKLISLGFEVIISSPNGDRIKELIEIGCSFVETKINRHGINPLEEIKLIISYSKIIKVVKPDVILTYTIKPNLYGGFIARIFRIPYISNITGLGSVGEKKSLLQFITIMLYKISFKNINTIFFQNSDNMDFFRRNNINPTKHFLLPGSGVNLEQFNSLIYPSSEKIEFSFISRIMKEKGINEYLQAAEILMQKYDNLRFNVCGFCEENYEGILSNFETRGIIKYHGMVKDIRPILSFTHCVIHPTFYPEGLSNILLESAACCRPIITTNRPGCREVIEDRVNGFLINQQDTNDLVLKIENFIKLNYNDQYEMGRAGRLIVEQKFDRKIVVDKYIEEINRILNQIQKNDN